MRTKEETSDIHRRKLENSKMLALTLAYIQVIGRSIRDNQPFSTDCVKREILSDKKRYGKINKAWWLTHGPAQLRTWRRQGKIRRVDGFVASMETESPLPLFIGIDNGPLFLKEE